MHRVLIVDDEPEIARSLRRVLREIYEVHLVASADEAMAKLDEVQPDVVISDFHMPEMNGAELLSDVHRRLPNSIRLLLSGLAELDVELVTEHIGSISRFVKKPWKNEELLEVIAELLDERERGDPPGAKASAEQHESP
jgi:response regulator RpfG family c-di-GMP phosphodiesterase